MCRLAALSRDRRCRSASTLATVRLRRSLFPSAAPAVPAAPPCSPGGQKTRQFCHCCRDITRRDVSKSLYHTHITLTPYARGDCGRHAGAA